MEFALAEFGPSKPRNILEPACGSGRLIRELAKRGFSVTGFDANPRMIEFAERRLSRENLTGRLGIGRMERFSYRHSFDLSHCLVSTFKYLLGAQRPVDHLQCVAQHLREGGIAILGLHLTEYDLTTRTRERWVARVPGGEKVVCNLQIWPADRRKRIERVRSRLRVEAGSNVRRVETEWNFRTYDVLQLKALIRSVSNLEHVATYDFSYDPDRPIVLDGEQLDLVLVLRKKR